MATINAHQLGRLIDKTISHMGSEYVKPLHGIRLDADATFLHAVASDRYTIAVARYRLNDDSDHKPFARTIPAQYLRSLREWTSTQDGSFLITITTEDDRLVFSAPHSNLAILTKDAQQFFNWRGVLRNAVTNTTDDTTPFPALSSGLLARWADTGDVLRVHITADEKPVLIFGEDFIGAQMPARYAGVGPVKEQTIEGARSLWDQTLYGVEGVDMATAMPDEEPDNRGEVTKDVRKTGADLLRQVLHSTADMLGKSVDNPDEFYAHILAGVHSWMAYRFLDALHTADPRIAEAVVAETAEQLDSGEIGEFAWDAAEKAGHDPQAWHDEYEAYLKKRAAEKTEKDKQTA